MQIRDIIPWARKDRPAPTQDEGEDNPLALLQRDVNRLFEDFWKRFEDMSLDWPWAETEARADMVETADDHVEVSIELPGLEMEDVELLVTDDALTVKGERKIERQEEKKGYYLSERTYGAIMRTIPLPPGLDPDKAEATFRNGVLTVRIPRRKDAGDRVRKIDING